MPVRTRRGRAGAYRALWTWPLHSPRRFVGVCAAAVALLALLAALGPTGSEPVAGSATGAAAGSGTAATGPTGAAEDGTGGVVELTPRRLPLADAPPAALTVAQRFTAAWADAAGTPPAAWVAGLAPWTTPEYLPVLGSTDPVRVPATRLTGAAVATDVRPDAVRVRVPTDAGAIELLLVSPAPGRWRVTDLDPADTAPPAPDGPAPDPASGPADDTGPDPASGR